jgi:hypothetical protein
MPNKSERPIMNKKHTTAYNINERLGLYSLSTSSSMSHAAKMISTTILHTKAFVVIKGKKRELDTKNGTNGMTNRPIKTTALSVCLFIATIVPC